MIPNYTNFFRLHGVRMMSQLMSPPVKAVTTLKLPLDSHYHYIDPLIVSNPDDEKIDLKDLGLQKGDPVLDYRDPVQQILLNHVQFYAPETVGTFVTRKTALTLSINAYHQKHKEFKDLMRFGTLGKNNRNLIVSVYNILAIRHVYNQSNVLAQYWERYNLWLTVFDTINKNFIKDSRQHFIDLHLPLIIPPLSWLNAAITEVFKTENEKASSQVRQRFGDDNSFMILHLWAWLSQHRELSLFSKLDQRAIDRVNIIWQNKGVWTVVNLGVLNSWRSESDKHEDKKLSPDMLGKRFIRFLMSLSQVKSAGLDTDILDAVNETAEPPVVLDSDGVIGDDPNKPLGDLTHALNQHGSVGHKPKLTLDEIMKNVTDAKIKAETQTDKKEEEAIFTQVEDVEKDLDNLEVVAKDAVELKQDLTTYTAYEARPDDPLTPVQNKIKLLTSHGMLSAAEARRYEQLAQRYKTIKPYGDDRTLEELMTVTPDDVKVPETNTIVGDKVGVLDNSMKSSSLKKFDQQYVKHLMPKNIAGAIMHLQQMGVIIQDYEVEDYDDLNNSTQIHTIKVIPVPGKPTTLRFTIDRIGEDGTFKSGNVIYRMRRQRGDLPIRKTKPNEVSLTSYVSKMFVSRLENHNYNYALWLKNKVTAKAMDPEDKTVMDIRFSNVFVNEPVLPRAYTSMASFTSGFKSSGYELYFDYAKVPVLFSKEIYKALEKHKSLATQFVPIGTTPTSVLIMDMHDTIHEIGMDGNTELKTHGTIEDFLQIDISKKPLEIAQVGIFTKDIPIGVILARQIGLGNLLKTLETHHGLVYRRERRGTRIALQPFEYRIDFQDITLVLDSRDKLNTLLLNGFNRYKNDIKRYSIFSFDKKDVYGNVFEDNGISARWSRELDMLFDGWIDPITKHLLLEMNEPTDLFNLFISATKKLMLDAHPKEGDMSQMRIKGYERIAGMATFEMMKAMRGYYAKPMSKSASVDLNPEAVHMAIVKDQTVMPIEQSNPIHSLKEKEVVVFAGAGGRTGRSMTDKSRTYHENDIGVIGENTVDSGDTATIVYLTADPNFTSLYGTTRRIGDHADKASKLISTSFLMTPGAQYDD